MNFEHQFLASLNHPERIYVASDNQLFIGTMARNLDIVVESASPNDPSGSLEPHDPFEACVWKLGRTNVDGIVLASDIGVRFGHDKRPQVKPKRDPECQLLNPDYNIPQKILDIYTRSEGNHVIWEAPFTLRSPDGEIRMVAITIETIVPQLSPEQISKYYSADSSAGVYLTSLLKDLYPDTVFIMRNHFGDEVVQISHEVAEEFIVNKTPSVDVLSQLVINEAQTILIGEAEVGLVAVSLIGCHSLGINYERV